MMDTWITDERGNKCGVEHFGGEAEAKAALDSLKECDNCTNCSDCSRCSRCYDCSHCSGCSDCSHCSGCSDCSHCSGCSRCSDCSGCYGCSRCSRCYGCSRCYDCSRCYGCSRCSRCYDCSRCSRCSECSHCSGCSECSHCSGCSDVAYLYNKKDLKGDSDSPRTGAPATPLIADIHKAVYAAVSRPQALEMGSWHTCDTTHCRGGWVVHLAGEAGYALERFHDTLLAAQLIYRASGYDINPCRFFDSNDDAMADMKKLAQS